MNRLLSFGVLPNLSPVVKFVGGPWDGMYTRMSGETCPEYVEMTNPKNKEQPAHMYQLWVMTDNTGITHTYYKHRGPKKNTKE